VIRNENLKERTGIQNLLTVLHWFVQGQILDRSRILRNALELIFKGKRTVG
jgi:hypothetical protein